MSGKEKDKLEEVKRAIEKFRSERRGKERIPEKLWADAVALLQDYPINVVWRELELKPEYLKSRAGLITKEGNGKLKNKSPRFLSLKASQLTSITNGVEKNSNKNKNTAPIIES